jgi:glyoxylase-like metal-dependent hydrolase (beta-lactamase superfamily II)
MSATVQHPQPLPELAPGLALARGGPGRSLNVYLLGSVVLDSGVRWSRRRLGRQLAGRQVTAHAITHAHFDHAGSSAWLCRTLGVPLWCGAGDAAAIGSGRVDLRSPSLRSAKLNSHHIDERRESSFISPRSCAGYGLPWADYYRIRQRLSC